MNRIDRLLRKAKPALTVGDRLSKDNPYTGENFEELLDYLDGENYRAPDMGTWAWEQFMWAMMNAQKDDEMEID